MGICCCREDEVVIDSDDFVRTFDSLSQSDTTPYYVMNDGKQRNVVDARNTSGVYGGTYAPPADQPIYGEPIYEKPFTPYPNSY